MAAPAVFSMSSRKKFRKHSPRKASRSNLNVTRKWSSEETDLLISMWEERENLYNTNVKEFRNRTGKANSKREIATAFNVEVEDVEKKMASLRTQLHKAVTAQQMKSGFDAPLTESQQYILERLKFLFEAGIANTGLENRTMPVEVKYSPEETEEDAGPADFIFECVEDVDNTIVPENEHLQTDNESYFLPEIEHLQTENESYLPQRTTKKKKRTKQRLRMRPDSGLLGTVATRLEYPGGMDALDMWGLGIAGDLKLIKSIPMVLSIKAHIQKVILNASKGISPEHYPAVTDSAISISTTEDNENSPTREWAQSPVSVSNVLPDQCKSSN